MSSTQTLHTRGNADLIERLPEAVAVFGSRSSTTYGDEIATRTGSVLTTAGIPVLTGGGYGIDAAVVRGVLANGGKPIVALACGVDKGYPSAHMSLFRAVIEAGGVLVTAAEDGAAPSRERFVERNLWMISRSSRTLVVEASMRSGAGAAGGAALMLGKSVGAYPGPTTSATSEGTHNLIASGARIVYDDHSLLAFARS